MDIKLVCSNQGSQIYSTGDGSLYSVTLSHPSPPPEQLVGDSNALIYDDAYASEFSGRGLFESIQRYASTHGSAPDLGVRRELFQDILRERFGARADSYDYCVEHYGVCVVESSLGTAGEWMDYHVMWCRGLIWTVRNILTSHVVRGIYAFGMAEALEKYLAKGELASLGTWADKVLGADNNLG